MKSPRDQHFTMSIKMKSPKKPKVELEIDSKTCKVDESAISIKVIKIDNKRLSMSIYNQIVHRDLLDYTNKENPKIKGEILGKIHRKSNNYHESKDWEFDILWITPEGHLAVWPLHHVFEMKGLIEPWDLPNRLNILNQGNHFNKSRIEHAKKEFKIEIPLFSEWKGYSLIPERPKSRQLEYNQRDLSCGVTNDSRLELIKMIKRDMEYVVEYDAALTAWSNITHPLYDEYIELLTPIVIEINRLIDKRNLVYQNLIKQITEKHQLFIGS